MSARRRLGALPELGVSWGLIVALVGFGVAFVLVWRFVPLELEVTVTLLVAFVGLVVVCSFLSAVNEQARWARSQVALLEASVPDEAAERPLDLVEMEKACARALRGESELYLSLRPELQRIAAARLSHHGIALSDEARAQALLGPLYDVVRPDAVRPDPFDERRIPIASLEAMIDSLERC